MNNFNLIDIPLISKLESMAVDSRTEKEGLKGAIRTIIKLPVSNFLNSNTVLGKKMSWDIPREYNNLQNMFIKSTLTSSGAPDPKSYFGARIFSEIVLRTKNGTVLFTIQPYYTYARIDKLKSSQIYNHLENATMPLETWNNSVCEIFTPLFGWFNNKPIETMYLEPLELVATVTSSVDTMGLTAGSTVSAGSFELHLHYNDRMYDPKKSLNKSMLISDSYQEQETVTCAVGSTSKSFILQCPHPVFCTHFVMSNSTQDLLSINRIVVESRGVTLFDMDRRVSYSLQEGLEETADVESGPFTIWWSRERSRITNSGLMYFGQSMYPVKVTCYFSAVPSVTYDIITIHEYFNELSIKDNIIKRSLPGYLEYNI